MLRAEDDGFFISTGYQIGEALQKVKNTGEIQKLSDIYEKWNNLLTQYNGFNFVPANTLTSESINTAIVDLSASAKGLVSSTTSPAYQAVLLALNTFMGFWNSTASLLPCTTGSNPNGDTQKFNNTPTIGQTTTCMPNYPGQQGFGYWIPVDEYAKINEAYQIIQAAFKKGIPALNSTKEKLTVTITGEKITNTNTGTDTTPTKTTLTATNDAQSLLTQASTIMNFLITQCPWVGVMTETICQLYNTDHILYNPTNSSEINYSLNAIQEMINTAQQIVTQTQQLNTNQQTPKDFDPNSPSNMALAQSMLKNVQSQSAIIESISEVVNNLNNVHIIFTPGSNPICVDSQSNCPNLTQTLNALGTYTVYYGNQINQATTIANSLIKNIRNDIANKIYGSSSMLNSPFQELGHNPFRRIGIISSQTNNGAMNGVGVQVGYKQFFGEKRRWGLRYYGFFDYNHAFIRSNFFNSTSNVFTYGVGSDALFNFINDKVAKNSKLSVGLFGGIAIAGTSWLNSQYVNLKTVSNVYNAKINTANFQFLFNLGLRMNLAKNKKKASDHAAQHGMELGVKIPTINTNYYSFMGAKLEYRRLYSVYLNYVFAY
ncbi:outer membrane beta-barrel protein [Helicobacter pylori]|nr:outer membrane beta-barrel protein [Helicobacter pylori]